jgi:type II secretory pathway component GspD/PulD (secretin)
MPITSEQHAELSKPDAVRIVTSGIPVQVTVADDAVKVRGIFSDVRDALALLKAHLTGVYESRLELDPAQYSKVSGTVRDLSYFNRMKESSNAEIDLDPSSNSIVIHGKRANVKKAKILVMGLLDFILPSNFEHVKVPKVFHSTVANAASLADVAGMSGASVALDRDLNSVSVETSLLTLAPDALANVLFFVYT